MSPACSLVLMIALALLSPPVDSSGQGGDQRDAAPPADLLSGPKVSPEAMRPGPVGGMTGDALVELGAEPDVTLIGRLDLTDAQREAYGLLLADRWGQFDRIVRQSSALLGQLQAITRNRDEGPRNRRTAGIMREVRRAFRPFFERGSFFDEFRPHLTDEQIGGVERMLNEVREARRALNGQREGGRRRTSDQSNEMNGERNGSDGMEREAPSRRKRLQRAARQRLQSFGAMLRESIERQIAFERESFDQFATDLDLTETQKQQANDIFRPFTTDRLTGGQIDPVTRARAFTAFIEILTPQQRRALRRLAMARHSDEKAPARSGQSRADDAEDAMRDWRERPPSRQPSPSIARSSSHRRQLALI